MAADFEELDSGPTGTWERGNFTGRREFLVFWEDITQFVIDALGTGGAGGGIGAAGPSQFPGYPSVWAKKVSLRPATDLIEVNASEGNLEGNTNQYDMAVMAVDYETAPPATGQDPQMPPHPSETFLEWDLDIGGQFFQPPGRSFFWIPGTGEPIPTTQPPPDANPGVFIPESGLILTWYNVAIPPLTYIRKARGKVNNAIFLGAYAQQVLFLGAKWYVGFDINGDVKYNLKYYFKEKTPISTSSLSPGTGAPPYDYGWNHFWSPEANTNGEHWFKTRPLAYQPIDLLPLFQYGP